VKRKALANGQHHMVKQCFVRGSDVVGVFVFYEFAFLNVESLLCYWQEGCRKKIRYSSSFYWLFFFLAFIPV